MNAPIDRGARRSRPSCRIRMAELRLGNVGGLRSLLPLDNLELDAIAFGERLEAAALDGAEVDEDIRPPLAGDEAVAFGVIEPLHGTLETCHEPYLLELCSRSSPCDSRVRSRCNAASAPTGTGSTAGSEGRGASF